MKTTLKLTSAAMLALALVITPMSAYARGEDPSVGSNVNSGVNLNNTYGTMSGNMSSGASPNNVSGQMTGGLNNDVHSNSSIDAIPESLTNPINPPGVSGKSKVKIQTPGSPE